MTTREDMGWRYAVKRFVPGAREDDKLSRALEAARLAPSAFGLMPWRVVVVEDADLRDRVLEHAYNQAKVTEAGHLLVFAHRAPLLAEDIAAHVSALASRRGLDAEAAEKTRARLAKSTLGRFEDAGLREWCRAQCYLGLGVFLAAAASERLDCCPMEGFKPEAVDEALGLKDRRLAAAALVTAGVRDPEDPAARQAKVRPEADSFVLRL